MFWAKIIAASLPWPTELKFLWLEFLGWTLSVRLHAFSFFWGGCCWTLFDVSASDLAVCPSTELATEETSRCAPSTASARSGQLSVVLKASSSPRVRHNLRESCDNIQRSLPFKLSSTRNWLTFVKQRRKPLWKFGVSNAKAVPTRNEENYRWDMSSHTEEMARKLRCFLCELHIMLRFLLLTSLYFLKAS